MKHTDYTVPGTPEACLARVEGFLRNDWTHAGSFSRPLTGHMVQFFRPRRSLIDSPLGWLILIVLTLVTAGVFMFVYVFYWLIFRQDYSASMQVIAAADSHTETRLTVKTDRDAYAKDMEGWIQEELIERRAAAWSTESPR